MVQRRNFKPIGVAAQIRLYNDWAKAMRKHWTGGQLYQLETAVKDLNTTLNRERESRVKAWIKKYGHPKKTRKRRNVNK